MRIDNTFIAHLCCNGLVLSLLLFLVTLSMLTDRAGCYNVRGKNSLYASLPLPSIPTELPPSPCAEKVNAFSDFLKCMNTIFRGFQISGMVLQRLRLHHTFIFLVTEKVNAFSDFLKCMNTIF